MKKVAEIRDKSSSLVHGSLQELNQRCRTKLSLLVKLRQSTKQVRFYSVFIGFRSASKGVIASRDGVTRSRDFFHHIVDSVYNYANSLLENFSGDTKNVIKFLQNNCFFSNYIRECKRVSLSDRQQYYCFIIKQLNVINKNVTCNSCKRKKSARSSCIFSLQLC